MKYFDDVPISDQFSEHPNGYTIAKDEIIDYAKKYDPVPFHIDEALAQQWGHPTVSAPGTLTEAIVVRLIHDNLMPIYVLGLMLMESRMPNPFYAGETVHLHSCLKNKRPSATKADRGTFEMHLKLVTTEGKIVYEGHQIAAIKKRPTDN